MTGFLLKQQARVRQSTALKDVMAKRTKREKFLLALMIFVGLAAILLYCIILPAISRLADLQAQVEDLTAQKSETLSVVEQKEAFQTALNAAEKSLSSGTASLKEAMAPETLDNLITGYLTDCKLEPRSLTMTGMVPERLEGIAGAGKQNQDVYAFACTADVVAMGYRANLCALLDQIKTENGVKLSHIQFGSEATGTTGGAGATGGSATQAMGQSDLPEANKQLISLTFKVYVLAAGRDAKAEFEAGATAATGTFETAPPELTQESTTTETGVPAETANTYEEEFS